MPYCHTRRGAGRAVSLLALGLMAGAVPFGALAQDEESAEGGSRWGLGLGATSLQRPYRDMDDEVRGFPLISYENRWVNFAGGNFDFKINDSDDLSFRVRARYAQDGYDAKDSPFMRGMDDRDDSVWAGAAVVWNTPLAKVSAEYLTDAMSNSKGSRAQLQAEHRFGFGRFGLTPHLGAEWVDKKYVAYYYGVLPDEATPLRAAYTGKATVNVEGGLRADYTFARKHTVFMDVSVTGYGDAIKDSPLVDGSNQTRTSIGYVYRF